MISGHGNIETAVSAIKLGAYDFIEKPFKADRLVLVADRALETSRLKREVSDLRTRGGAANRIVGPSHGVDQSPAASSTRSAPANSRILISGRAGLRQGADGADDPREFGARRRPVRRHQRRRRSRPRGWRPSCSASRRATSAGRKVGALEEAHGGTLYLDEVADMPRETQAKILRVLVDQNFQRVGGATRVHVDVRIISSTSRDLAGGDRRGRASARICSTASRSCRSACRRCPSGARTSPNWSSSSWSRSRPTWASRPAQDRRRRHGGAAVARLAGQHPPAAQQRRAADDPGARRPERRNHGRHAALRDRRAGAGDAERHRAARS